MRSCADNPLDLQISTLKRGFKQSLAESADNSIRLARGSSKDREQSLAVEACKRAVEILGTPENRPEMVAALVGEVRRWPWLLATLAATGVVRLQEVTPCRCETQAASNPCHSGAGPGIILTGDVIIRAWDSIICAWDSIILAGDGIILAGDGIICVEYGTIGSGCVVSVNGFKGIGDGSVIKVA